MKEKWKQFRNTEYFVSNLGRVCRRGAYLKPIPSGGYLIVNIEKKSYGIHRLVLECFVRPPVGDEEGDHEDFDTHNNALSNLKWRTPSQNIKRCYALGVKSNKGSKNSCSKLTEA